MREKTYTHEEVESSFHKEVRLSKQDSQRVPARSSLKEAVYQTALSIFNTRYRDALHPSVLNRYR